MSKPAILVDQLSKRYRINAVATTSNTLVGAMAGLLSAPVRNYRRLLKLTRFDTDADDAADTVWALRDVSFQIAQGEVVGLIGANGAGKSTLLKVLARISEPSSGRAILRGRVASLLEVGTGFHPELTGRENTYLNGTILGMTRAEVARKFDEIVDFSGIEKFIDTPVKWYSSGMRVRLAFAVAAHLEPEILFVDEVLAVGDAAFQKKCLGRMKTVTGLGRTIIFVSHNMSAIRTLCRRCLLLGGGQLVMDADTDRCVSRYLEQATTASTPRIDTTHIARHRPSESLHIHHVSLQVDSDTAVLDGDGPLGVTIEFECVSAVDNLICGFYVENREGVIPFMVWSYEGAKPIAVTPGRYVARGSIPRNYLAPGQYYLGIIVASDSQHSGDWLPRVVEFAVQDVTYDSIDEYWLQQAPGLLKGMDSKWEIERFGG